MSTCVQVTTNRCFVIFLYAKKLVLYTYKKWSTKFECIFFLMMRTAAFQWTTCKLKIGVQCLLIGWFTLGCCSPWKWLNSKRCDVTACNRQFIHSPRKLTSRSAHVNSQLSYCQVEEADHIYLLMKEEYRISRNVRLAWFLGKLNQVIWPASKPELVSCKNQSINRYLQEDTITTNNAWDVEEPKSKKSPV